MQVTINTISLLCSDLLSKERSFSKAFSDASPGIIKQYVVSKPIKVCFSLIICKSTKQIVFYIFPGMIVIISFPLD